MKISNPVSQERLTLEKKQGPFDQICSVRFFKMYLTKNKHLFLFQGLLTEYQNSDILRRMIEGQRSDIDLKEGESPNR